MTAKPKPAPAPARPAAPTFPWRRYALTVASIAALVWGVMRASQSGWELAADCVLRSQDLRLLRSDLQYTANPDWLKTNVVEESLNEAGISQTTFDLHQPDLAQRLGSAIQRSLWVESVRVRKAHRTVRIDIQYRKPVLFVPWNELGFYLDRTGTVLPVAQVDKELLQRCLILRGVEIARLPEVGIEITDARVALAAELAGRLDAEKDRRGIGQIEVESRPGEPFRCLLLTREGLPTHGRAITATDKPSEKLY